MSFWDTLDRQNLGVAAYRKQNPLSVLYSALAMCWGWVSWLMWMVAR
jgi:hypothetical protein